MGRLVDVHTHMYPPSYIALLSSRTTTPYIYNPSSNDGKHGAIARLIILPSDDDPAIPQASRGRPIDSSYSSIHEKLSFMKKHNIATSVISLANPWLDFLPSDTALRTAQGINDEMANICAAQPGVLYAFGTLPLSAPPGDIVTEIERLATVPEIKGIILGTTGLGKGLDDPGMAPLWEAMERAGLLIFLHPHYGLPSEVFGPRQHDSGHVLPLALGFPLETTIAFTRLYLAGVFDTYPNLKILLAHAGGAIPFLSGRIDSCMLHERVYRNELGLMQERKTVWEVLRRNVWLDGVVYSQHGITAAEGVVGKDRVLWGTDHPFFPPIGKEGGDRADQPWASVQTNITAVMNAFEGDAEGRDGVLGENAVRLLQL